MTQHEDGGQVCLHNGRSRHRRRHRPAKKKKKKENIENRCHKIFACNALLSIFILPCGAMRRKEQGHLGEVYPAIFARPEAAEALHAPRKVVHAWHRCVGGGDQRKACHKAGNAPINQTAAYNYGL